MGIDSVFQFFVLTLEVFFLDLVLSGDNAVVIALACRSLPAQERRQVMVAGTGIAIALRIVLTLLASFVLRVPLLKLLGGIALTVIAVRLTLADQGNGAGGNGVAPKEGDLLSALGTVVLADLAMSTDNVVALAALAHGNVGVLALGLVLSVPLLMFGSWYVTMLLRLYPALTPIAGAMLGWLAGDIAISDPLYAGWIEQQSPALSIVVPMLAAAYVLAQSRIIDRTRASAAALRPSPTSGKLIKVRAEGAAALVAVAAGQAAPTLAVRRERNVPAGARKKGTRRALLPWLIGSAVLALLGVGSLLLNAAWLPVPAGLTQYDCSAKGFLIHYRMGGDRIRLTSAGNTVSGIVRPDNQIDWGDLHDVSKTLGFVPPIRVVYADAQNLRVEGGMSDGLACHAR